MSPSVSLVGFWFNSRQTNKQTSSYISRPRQTTCILMIIHTFWKFVVFLDGIWRDPVVDHRIEGQLIKMIGDETAVNHLQRDRRFHQVYKNILMLNKKILFVAPRFIITVNFNLLFCEFFKRMATF